MIAVDCSTSLGSLLVKWFGSWFECKAPTPTTPHLTVVNGSGSGDYAAGIVVPIKAVQPTDGTVFERWTGDIQYIANDIAASTTCTMPSVNVSLTATFKTPTPTDLVELGSWGGRPSCALDKTGKFHAIVDGGMSPQMAVFDVDTSKKVTTSIINAATWNPLTQQLFNPSQVILNDDTQLVTCWWFAANVEDGCTPRVLYRANASTTPGPWRDLIVHPSSFPWEPAKICPMGIMQATDFGMMNSYYELSMVSGNLALGTGGQYGSGGGGGGEKEARMILPDGTKHVANSGCSKTKGGWYRNSVSCDFSAMWASYARYPKMGNDDTGHCGVAGDLTNNRIGYMCASWDSGLVYNVWDGSKMLYPVDNLPVIDSNGWSGMYKFPLAMASCPTGGAYVVWTNGNTVWLGKITPTGLVTTRQVCDGQIATLCVGPDGMIHLVYNLAGKMYYRQVQP